MGTGDLETKNAGDVISEDDPNQFKSALDGDVVPRDTSGIATDIIGNLGSIVYRWANAYLKKITLGVAANLVTLEEASSAFLVKISGTTKASIDTNGIDGAYMKVGSILRSALSSTITLHSQTFTSSGSFVVPANVGNVLVMGCGGGGGGGGDVSGAGNSGGDGARLGILGVPTTPGGTIAVVIGAGGAGGGSNLNGSPGVDSSFGTVVFKGGSNGNASGTITSDLTRLGQIGGKVALAGGNSEFFAGGTTPGATQGGGGGAGPFGIGGAGGNSANGGAAGANTGAGGGGCGTGTHSGGNGGSGQIIVMWTE